MASFNGTFTISNGPVAIHLGILGSATIANAAEQSPQPLTATFSLNSVSGDVTVTALSPPLTPFTTSRDTITPTLTPRESVSGFYTQNNPSVMDLTFPITLTDTMGLLSPNPQNVTFNLSTIGSPLTVGQFGQVKWTPIVRQPEPSSKV